MLGIPKSEYFNIYYLKKIQIKKYQKKTVVNTKILIIFIKNTYYTNLLKFAKKNQILKTKTKKCPNIKNKHCY